MHLYVVGILSWWYGAGWKQRARLISERLDRTMDYFSLGLLLRTLTAPFRQISAGTVTGSLEVKFRAFIDRLISRLIGMIIRLVILLVGLIVISFHAIWGAIVLIGWGLVPTLPIIGLSASAMGWGIV